jgi:hypothetical protein
MEDISRRTVLGIIGAAGGLAATGGLAPPAGASGHGIDLDDHAQLFTAFRKLAHSADSSVGWWWLRGTRFGVVDSVATPFWDMYVGTWFRTRDLDDGGYEVTMAGANFYTPPNETTLLRSFNNPYTGEEVPVQYAAPRVSNVAMSVAKSSPFGEFSMPGMKSTQNSAVGPAWIEGEDFVIRGDLELIAEPVDPDSGARTFVVNDWSTYVGKVSDVTDPAVKNAPCRQYFTDILRWPGWLNMGDQPGSYVSRCYGRKETSMEQMPATWRTLFAEAQPEAAKDPAAILDT